MQNKPSFYITTTLPYVNGLPHIGHAMEFVRADSIARYKELMDMDVYFNTGTDEHGQKIAEKAEAEGKEVKEYVDYYAGEFKRAAMALGLKEEVNFIRTTDEKHIAAAQEMWRRCDANGYIYKKNYQAKYCVGCELFKSDSECEDGHCIIHPHYEIELIDEENYFFKFSAFQEKLLELYNSKDFVVPEFRQKEITTFVEGGLQDFSISRLKEKMSWGVPVPGDDNHVMYVWFDALTNYISTLDWPVEGEGSDFDKYWVNGNPIQYCGKDNLRQQSAMWQAMLMAAGLPNSDKIIINGFINSGGQKMSKSLGNVINPFDMIDHFKDVTAFPEEALRYYLLRHINPFEDSDMTMEKVEEAYTANLVNGLGNLVSRLLNMCEKYEVEYDTSKLFYNVEFKTCEGAKCSEYHARMEGFNIQKAMDSIWSRVKDIDEEITSKEPFKVFKTDPDKARSDLDYMVYKLGKIVKELKPLMPKTSAAIAEAIEKKQKPETPLFGRLVAPEEA